MDSKVCTHCREDKPVVEFSPLTRQPGAYASWCRQCTRNGQRARRLDNAEKWKSDRLLYDYGITLTDYEDTLASQGGVCAICLSEKIAEGKGYMHVDHDHETKQVRGILCGSCNTGIGLLGGNAESLLAAYEYLARWEEV